MMRVTCKEHCMSKMSEVLLITGVECKPIFPKAKKV